MLRDDPALRSIAKWVSALLIICVVVIALGLLNGCRTISDEHFCQSFCLDNDAWYVSASAVTAEDYLLCTCRILRDAEKE